MRFGYTGQQNLSGLGVQYYKARMYSADLGRFIQTDPIGMADDMNLYAYVGNNAVNRRDPSGKTCVASGNSVTCNPGAGLPVITFPRPNGWPSTLDDSQSGYHLYSYSTNAGLGNQSYGTQLQNAIKNDPTPGNDRPASLAGTPNDAFSMLPLNGNVLSYNVPVQSGDRNVTFNVTQPGHYLFPGYVIEDARQSANGNWNIQTAGEGLQGSQANSVAFGITKVVWDSHSNSIINSVKSSGK